MIHQFDFDLINIHITINIHIYYIIEYIVGSINYGFDIILTRIYIGKRFFKKSINHISLKKLIIFSIKIS